MLAIRCAHYGEVENVQLFLLMATIDHAWTCTPHPPTPPTRGICDNQCDVRNNNPAANVIWKLELRSFNFFIINSYDQSGWCCDVMVFG